MIREIQNGDVIKVTKYFNDGILAGETATVIAIKDESVLIEMNEWLNKETNSFEMKKKDIEEYFEIFTEGYKVQKFIKDRITDNGEIIESDGISDISDLINAANEKFNCNLEVKILYMGEDDGEFIAVYTWAGIIDGALYLDGSAIV